MKGVMFMLNVPIDVLTQFPVRKSREQKQCFRDAVCAWARRQGYSVTVENGSFGARNIVIGDPNQAQYLVTAHYDTPAAMPLPNLITPMNPVTFLLYQLFLAAALAILPMLLSFLLGFVTAFEGILIYPPEQEAELVVLVFLVWYISFLLLYALAMAMLYFGPANKNNANDNTSGVVTVLEIARTLQENQRHKVCFVLFDLEEKGLWGSRSYRKIHREATDHQLIINLDCVGDGDHIRMFPTKKLKKDRRRLTSLYCACGYFGKKSLLVHEKGFGYNPSDHKHFPYGVGILALKKSKFGLYLGRIHTRRDTVLEETNINILRAALTTYICRDAAQ